MSSRCKSCDSKFLARDSDVLCSICEGYAAGRMPLVRRYILRTSKGFTFGRVLRLSELLSESFNRIVLTVLLVLILALLLSGTSDSILINIPIAILLLGVLRRLSFEFDIQWRRKPNIQFYSLQKNFRNLLSSESATHRQMNRAERNSLELWKEGLSSPLFESSVENLVDLIVRDFFADLFYNQLTPDTEAPTELKRFILVILGDIVTRVKRVNLINFLTKDVVELLTINLRVFRDTRAALSTSDMDFTTVAEREAAFQSILTESGQIHVACISPENEHKVLNKLSAGILAKVLSPSDASCHILHLFVREVLTACVLKPVISLTSPKYINSLLLTLLLQEGPSNDKPASASGKPKPKGSAPGEQVVENLPESIEMVQFQGPDVLPRAPQSAVKGKAEDWASLLDQKRAITRNALNPEHLESVWFKGRKYKEKEKKRVPTDVKSLPGKGRKFVSVPKVKLASAVKGEVKWVKEAHREEDRPQQAKMEAPEEEQSLGTTGNGKEGPRSLDSATLRSLAEGFGAVEGTKRLERSKSSDGSDLGSRQSTAGDSRKEIPVSQSTAPVEPVFEPISKPDSEPLSQENRAHKRVPAAIPSAPAQPASSLDGASDASSIPNLKIASKIVTFLPPPTFKPGALQARVVGAYSASGKSSLAFVLFSVSVVDPYGACWTIHRRYRNFESLHKALKVLVPTQSLKFPPKRYLSSHLSQQFVLQRRAHLDEFLQEVLSNGRLSVHPEVIDFLSVDSERYSSACAPASSSSSSVDPFASWQPARLLAVPSLRLRQPSLTASSDSLNVGMKEGAESASAPALFPEPSGSKEGSDADSSVADAQESVPALASESMPAVTELEAVEATVSEASGDDELAVPFEWNASNLSLPILTFVDSVFELHNNGWIRRQVMWVARELLQLILGDAVDDFLLNAMQKLASDQTLAAGVQLLQEVLWPGGVFYRQYADHEPGLDLGPEADPEVVRRVNQLLLDLAPTTVLSLIGSRAYKRGVSDICEVLQSPVFMKQLSFGALEAIVVSLFPDLHGLVAEIRAGKV